MCQTQGPGPDANRGPLYLQFTLHSMAYNGGDKHMAHGPKLARYESQSGPLDKF